MSFEVIEAVDSHSVDSGEQPLVENVTQHERIIIRFYRQLGEDEQLMMMRMLEALVTCSASPG